MQDARGHLRDLPHQRLVGVLPGDPPALDAGRAPGPFRTEELLAGQDVRPRQEREAAEDRPTGGGAEGVGPGGGHRSVAEKTRSRVPRHPGQLLFPGRGVRVHRVGVTQRRRETSRTSRAGARPWRHARRAM